MNNKVMIETMRKDLKVGRSFDVVCRNIVIAGRTSALFFIDGFIKDEVFEKILEFLFKIQPEELQDIPNMEAFSKIKMPYVEVQYETDYKKAETQILCGVTALIIDGIAGILLVDTRTYPVRSISEPEKDKTLRGSRDGFVETLIFNTAMIRRRIRDTRLVFEHLQVGDGSRVDVAIAYIDGLADEKIVDKLRNRLSKLKVTGASMSLQAISETLLPSPFFNPFPNVKFTERPDYASACIMEGKVILVIDNTPSAMVFPSSFADFTKETDDYCFPALTGTFVRIIRLAVSLLSVIMTPLALWLLNNPTIIPDWLMFLIPTVPITIPIFWQFLMVEFINDGLRLASLNTPDSLSNALGIIGGLILSEFAISANWFVPEIILFMAFVAIASYAQPSFEMGYAMKYCRLLLLVLVQLFGLWGFAAGIVIILAVMLSTKTLTGYTYLRPIFPFVPKEFLKLFVRTRIKNFE
ncbi:MAG: spore germination protein [Clostridia bacterium]|nr:spore germination protein [Clostridia bacterium]